MAYTNIAAIGEMVPHALVEFEHGNKCAFMDLNNVVYICDNIMCDGIALSETLLTLPDETMFPSFLQVVMIPGIVRGSANVTLIPIQVNESGEFKPLIENVIILYSAGFSFHINGRYYNPEIGNIYNNGTSPLTDGGW